MAKFTLENFSIMNNNHSVVLFLDKIQARLITGNNGIASFTQTIESELNPQPRIRGEGSNQARFSRDPYLGSNNEFHQHRQEEQIMHNYFRRLSHLLLPYPDILLSGPGETKKEFRNFLLQLHAFRGRNLQLQSIPELTDRQLLALAEEFFSFAH